MNLLRRVWDAIAFAGTLIGIIYIPANLFGLADTYPSLQRVTAMIDRFDVLAGFSAIAVLYIFWIDLRPMLRRFFSKASFVSGPIECKSSPIKLGDETYYYNKYYLPIINTRIDRKTIEGLRAILHLAFSSEVATFYNESDTDSANVDSGEKVLVIIGSSLTKNISGLPIFMDHDIPDIDHWVNNVENGHISFRTKSTNFVVLMAGEPHNTPDFYVIAKIESKNVESRYFEIGIGYENQKPKIYNKNHLGQAFEPQEQLKTAAKKLPKTFSD